MPGTRNKREDLTLLPDEELAKICRAGGRERDAAEETLMRRYKSAALRKSREYYLTGADREDALQECMIGLFEAIRDFDPEAGSSFSSFADLCMDRAMISAVRSATRQKQRPLNESVSLDRMLAETAESGTDDRRTFEELLSSGGEGRAEEARRAGELADELEARLTGGPKPALSRLERQVWKYLRQGLTYREIAAEMGREPKSIDNAIQRIRRKSRSVWPELFSRG